MGLTVETGRGIQCDHCFRKDWGRLSFSRVTDTRYDELGRDKYPGIGTGDKVHICAPECFFEVLRELLGRFASDGTYRDVFGMPYKKAEEVLVKEMLSTVKKGEVSI